MTEAKLPGRIFMATDLSARCDRALARAALPARAVEGELTVADVAHAAAVVWHDGRTSSAPSWRRLTTGEQFHGGQEDQ